MEHKIYYKCNMEIPEKLKNELKDAQIPFELDMKMEPINKEISKLKDASNLDEDTQEILLMIKEHLRRSS